MAKYKIIGLPKQTEEYFELDLTPEEIEEYARGGFIVEDISVPSLSHAQDGGEPKNRKLRLRQEDYDPANEAGYIQETPDVSVADPTIWGKYGRKYEQDHSKEAFINRKKKQFLALHPGLNKREGVTMENFPANVEQNFGKEYDYKKHTAMVKGVSKEEGWNPKKRKEYVDDLTAQGRRIVSDSKYGSKLQPGTWDRAIAGVGTLLSPFSSGITKMMNEGYMPGLTKKESKRILNSKMLGIPTGGLEVFAPINTVGQNIANYAKNRGLSTGSDYKQLPGLASGEFMPNVTDMDAMGLDPIQMALGIYGLAELPVTLSKGLGKAYTQVSDDVKKLATRKTPVTTETVPFIDPRISRTADPGGTSLIRFGDEAHPGNEWYRIDPEDYNVLNETTNQLETSPNWRQEGLQDANESIENSLSKLPSFSSESTKGLGDWQFNPFTPGWEALEEAKGFTMRGPKMPKKTDFYNDREFQDLLMNEMQYNIAKDEQRIQEALTGKKFTDEDFKDMHGALKSSNFREKYLTPEQEKAVRQILFDNESVKSNPLLKENLEAALARSERINPLLKNAKKKPFRSGDLPMSLNAIGETSVIKPSSRLPREIAEQNALTDLESLRRQTIMGQDEAAIIFEKLQEQKLKDLNTAEGRRRIQEFIDDNDIKGDFDEGNYEQLKKDYETNLSGIIKKGDTNEIKDVIERVKKHYAGEGLRGSRLAKNSNIQSWDELTAADLERVTNPSGIHDFILKDNIERALAKTDTKNTAGYKKFTVDDYIEHIEGTQYDDMFMQITGEEMHVESIKKSLKNKVNERNQLRREYDEGKMTQAEYKKKQRASNEDVLDLELQLKNAEAGLKKTKEYMDRSNASANAHANTINIGNQHTSIGNLEPTIYHEFGHITEDSRLPLGSNSAIDKDLITGIDFLDETPEYLFESIDPDKVLSETSPYNLTSLGIKKYKEPEGYFNNAKEYFLKGNGVNPSREPSSFTVELRPALKRVGLIENDFDKVTPEMLQQLYETYMSSPEFKFLDLRIFDIMKPTEKSFKTISKNLNKIKGIAPYAVPIGLGVGATGLGGQEEMQQDMEYQRGGFIRSSKMAKLNKFIN